MLGRKVVDDLLDLQVLFNVLVTRSDLICYFPVINKLVMEVLQELSKYPRFWIFALLYLLLPLPDIFHVLLLLNVHHTLNALGAHVGLEIEHVVRVEFLQGLCLTTVIQQLESLDSQIEVFSEHLLLPLPPLNQANKSRAKPIHLNYEILDPLQE